MVPFQVLFEQFKFFLNLYFLVMALSQFIPEIRIGYLYTYWGPLVSTFWYPVSTDQFYFQFYMTSLWYMLHKVNPQQYLYDDCYYRLNRVSLCARFIYPAQLSVAIVLLWQLLHLFKGPTQWGLFHLSYIDSMQRSIKDQYIDYDIKMNF